MKIKKYNENNHLHNTDEGLEHYAEWFNNFLSKFIDENDISHSELLNSGNDLVLVVEFNCNDLTSKVFNDISLLLKEIEKDYKYEISSNKNDYESWISIQTLILESEFPEDLRILKNTGKYNL